MHYSWLWQWVMLTVLPKTFPVERFALTASIQPFKHHTLSQAVEVLQGRHITADPIVLIMASQFCLKDRPPFLCFLIVPYFPEPVVHLFAFHTKLLPAGFSEENEFPLTILTAVVGKSKKVKGVGPAFIPECVLSFKPAKTDYTSLFWM